mgnify:CR=1 FL=1
MKVIKRDGRAVDYNREKIAIAIGKANAKVRAKDRATKEQIKEIIKYIEELDRKRMLVEDIQDIIEQVLINDNYTKTAKEYIIYRQKRGEARTDKKNLVDVVSSINEYLDRLDWRVNANANQGYSLGGMILNISGKMVANYWLNRVYPEL